jgi:hypothetical protein
MADIPFWKHDAGDDDTPRNETAIEIPTREGGESAIDPQTGQWRPIKRGDLFTLADHEFRWNEGPIATAVLHDGDGHELGTVHLPFDPETRRPEDGFDDLFPEAVQFFQDMQYMRSIVRQDAIDNLVESIIEPETREARKSLAEEMIAGVAEVLAGGVNVTVTVDGDEDELTPEQCDAVSTEATRIFDEQLLPELTRELATIPTEDDLTFWQQFAREIIATATLHARDDVMEEVGGRDAVAALEGEASDEFERQVLEAYSTGPYLAGAMLSLTRTWTQTLAEFTAAAITHVFEDDAEREEISNKILAKARKSLGLPDPPPGKGTPPTMRPAFDADGYGRTSNNVVSIGARRAFTAHPSRWRIVSSWPEFSYENGSGKALYSPSRAHFPTARDAMRAVESYSPAHVAMLKYVMAKHMANHTAHTTGPYGGFYLGVDEFLEFRGIKKHVNGGYRPEDRREVVELLEALHHIDVAGTIEGHDRQPGKRGKKIPLSVRSPLIVVSHTVTQPSMIAGEERTLAWYLRLGDWSAELERITPQFAVTTRALLQLHTQNDAHAFNLGNCLSEQYRIRASQRSWQQPYRVRTLLADAEIELDRKNPGRFRKRIEAALDVLANRVAMQGTPIIERWVYANVVEPKGRGWFDAWLDCGIIITPPESLIAPYANIGRPRRPTKPKRLAG